MNDRQLLIRRIKVLLVGRGHEIQDLESQILKMYPNCDLEVVSRESLHISEGISLSEEFCEILKSKVQKIERAFLVLGDCALKADYDFSKFESVADELVKALPEKEKKRKPGPRRYGESLAKGHRRFPVPSKNL